MALRVAVIGCGHVGLVTAAGLASIGHTVAGIDNDAERVRQLGAGVMPFHEPGLPALVAAQPSSRLWFTTDIATGVAGADLAFICVNTPPRPDGGLSLTQVERVARAIADTPSPPRVVVEKSTVPVRTARRIGEVLSRSGAGAAVAVASNPEFLREGTAVADMLGPDRIVVGVDHDGPAAGLLAELYRPIVERTGCPYIQTDLDTAELVKHACNSFLAVKISFSNLVAEVCERVGADVSTVSAAMGLDPRIGPHFLAAGVGYGGFCLPKDLANFAHQGESMGVRMDMLHAVRSINSRQRSRFVDKLREAMWTLDGKTIGVWGVAFKAGTDDVREAPSLDVIPALVAEGARVRVYDPEAGHEAKSLFPDVTVVGDAQSAAAGADALAVLTEWQEFADFDLDELKGSMRTPVVVDGRNLWSAQDMAARGFTYLSFGRPDVVGGEIRRPQLPFA